jgi:formylglycine-generating enzyme required for sulfatase activity
MKKTMNIMALIILSLHGISQNDSIVVRVRNVDVVMMKVEGGTYQRGCTYDEDCHGCCLKQVRGEHSVTVESFYMAKIEVTQELYLAVMGKNPSWFKPDSAITRYLKRPVESISWYDAQDFIDTLNAITGLYFRLPTEAEWEYAARGGRHDDPFVFAGSNDVDEITWYHYDDPNILNVCHASTKPSGKKKPNSLGLYDMTGNVAEWCSDWYSDNYYQRQKRFQNPQGPTSGETKVVRGGSFGVLQHPSLEVRYRRGVSPEKKDMHIGFRIVLDKN